jgi:hypothetical protein
MQIHPTAKSLLEEIADNGDRLTLTHSEVLAIGQALDAAIYLSDAINKFPSLDFYLNCMRIYGLTHKQRSFFAKRALGVIEVYESKKYLEATMSPDNF